MYCHDFILYERGCLQGTIDRLRIDVSVALVVIVNTYEIEILRKKYTSQEYRKI
jgi:hypothetical protein